MAENQTRRRFLAAVGALGVASVAGCSSSSGSQSDGESGGSDGSSGGGSDGGSDGSDSGSGGSGDWTETSTVEMTDELKFEPKRIQVSAGTTVTWENVGAVGHSVTAYEGEIPDGAAYFASGGFDSEQAANDAYPEEGNIKEGESYEHTFETKGTYKYYCIPHEMNGMVGYVKVV